MRRLLLALAVGVVIVAVAWFMAGIPGQVSATIGTMTVETSAPMAILGLIVLVAVILLVIRILGSLWRVPRATARWRRRQRLRGGEKAITNVLLALAAGEQGPARKHAHKARQLLGESPQTLLLVAEASRLSGNEDEAAAAYRALAKHKDASFLGLRGLLRQAVDRRDWQEATELAKQAERAHPGTVWLRQQRAELALQANNWADALELIGPDPKRTIYYVAASEADTDPVRAASYAKQAWKADPTFAPAVLAHARRLRDGGYESRARSVVVDAWSKAPHPDLASFLLAPETSKLARMQAAKRLTERNPSHPESRILLAQTALEAGLPGEARRHTDLARADGVNQRRLCLLVAAVEEQDRGDTEEGRLAQREALRQAATADADPHWACGNCRSEQSGWHPKCSVCGSVGTLQWVTSSVAPVMTSARVPAVVV